MFIPRGLLAVGLALVLTAAVSAAPLQNGRMSSSGSSIQGTIVKVHHDRAHRGAGWILVRRPHHNRRGGAAAAAVGRNRAGRGGRIVRVAFNRSTRFDHLGQGGNGAANVTRTSAYALRSGHRVRVLSGMRQHHVAREVAILSSSSNRSANRRSNGNGSNNARRLLYRRNSLVGSRVLARYGRPQYHRMNRRRLNQTMVTRAVHHALIEGRAAWHKRHHHAGGQGLSAAMKKNINQAVRRDVRKDLHQAHKHQGTAHKISTRHAATKRSAPKPAHSAGRAKPPAHRKR